jgi:NitT/TauT family transport system ATP-binding protein/sulfonate transport system ATP-binding protein
MADGPRLNIDVDEKRFPGSAAPLLVNFHVTIPPSQVVALVGPSGIGKSSLLRMIAGIDDDYSGAITIDGKAADAAPPAGFVFQDSRLLPWLSALDNIRAVRKETTEAEARDLLARVGLAGSEDAYPSQLSGGMQRRVALARAFSVNPCLLLLDEPFVSLDAHLVAGVQRVFLDLVRDTGSTAILVTHLPDDAARIADRAIVLGGRPARIAADIELTPAREARSEEQMRAMALALSNYDEAAN